MIQLGKNPCLPQFVLPPYKLIISPSICFFSLRSHNGVTFSIFSRALLARSRLCRATFSASTQAPASNFGRGSVLQEVSIMFLKKWQKNATCRRRALLSWNISSFSFKPWCVALQTRWFQPVGSPADCLTWSNLNSAVLERTGKGKKQDSIRWHLCEWRDKIDNQVTA